jgi:SPFH domain / Band 7 family
MTPERTAHSHCKGPGISVFRRHLSADECAVIVKHSREPQLLDGPSSVRTFWRWKRVVVVDRKPFAIDIPPETVLALADAPVLVSAQIQGQVVDPVAAALNVVDYQTATRMLAQTAIRAVMKNHPADDLGSSRTDLEAAFIETLDEAAQSWGVSVLSGTLTPRAVEAGPPSG